MMIHFPRFSFVDFPDIRLIKPLIALVRRKKICCDGLLAHCASYSRIIMIRIIMILVITFSDLNLIVVKLMQDCRLWRRLYLKRVKHYSWAKQYQCPIIHETSKLREQFMISRDMLSL